MAAEVTVARHIRINCAKPLGRGVGLMAIWHSPCIVGIVFVLLSPSRKSLIMLLRQTVTTQRSYAYQRCMSTTYGMGRTFKNCRDSGLVQLPGVLHFACERGGIKIRGAEKNYSRARKK